jgi:BlaI family penicillinase repressor
MTTAPRISEAEWEVMKALWKKSPRRAQEIIQDLSPSTKWSPATIKTLLNRLVGKGALRFVKEGKAYLYSPAYSEKDFRAAEADSFLSRIFDGALSPMISHFVQSRHLTQKEWDALEQMMRERKKEK